MTQHANEIRCPWIIGFIEKGGKPELPHLGLRNKENQNHREIVDEEKFRPQKVQTFDEMVNMMKSERLSDHTFLFNNDGIHVIERLM